VVVDQDTVNQDIVDQGIVDEDMAGFSAGHAFLVQLRSGSRLSEECRCIRHRDENACGRVAIQQSRESRLRWAHLFLGQFTTSEVDPRSERTRLPDLRSNQKGIQHAFYIENLLGGRGHGGGDCLDGVGC
jgi:hypothetical protein